MDTVQKHIFLSGRVQGVGFRQFARKTALNLGVAGWVQNLDDGRVELLIQGGREDIEKMSFRLRKGPSGSSVEEMESRNTPVEENLSTFVIKS